MRDPHVESLRYQLQPDEKWEYANAPPLKGETNDFRYVLEDRILTLQMKTHFASVEEARAIAAEFLLIWEIDATLRVGRGAVKFAFLDVQLIDRIPPPPGTFEVNISGTSSIVIGGNAIVRVTQAAYPEPPPNMALTPNVETLWLRYSGYQANREPLSAMAYFCLTVINASAGGQSNAAAQYNIDLEVLRKIGELTATRGDGATARKMQSNLVPYTPSEINWLEAAVKLIIRRVAEIASGANCAKLTLTDLPAL